MGINLQTGLSQIRICRPLSPLRNSPILIENARRGETNEKSINRKWTNFEYKIDHISKTKKKLMN